jgi:hypothetical protein
MLALGADVVGALLMGTTTASADPRPTPDPVVDDTPAPTAPIRTGLAEDPPPVPVASPVAPRPDPPTLDPVVDDAPPSVRTGRVGDPAGLLTATAGAVEVPTANSAVPGASAPPATSGSGKASPPASAPTLAPAAAPNPLMTPAAPASPDSYTVLSGDNLWEIAAAQLATATGRDRASVGTAEVTTYWLRVCVANRNRVHSGNVNLIYPGEAIELPPI